MSEAFEAIKANLEDFSTSMQVDKNAPLDTERKIIAKKIMEIVEGSRNGK